MEELDTPLTLPDRKLFEIDDSVNKDTATIEGTRGGPRIISFDDEDARADIDTKEESQVISHHSQARSTLRSKHVALESAQSRESRNKTVSPTRLKTLKHMDEKTLERLNRIALKGFAFDQTLRSDLNAASRQTLGLKTGRRWTLAEDFSRRNIHKVNRMSSRKSIHEASMSSIGTKTLTSPMNLVNYNNSPMLSGNASIAKLRLGGDSTLGRETGFHSPLLLDDVNLSQTLRPELVGFSPAPQRARLLPELTASNFDVTIYSPQEQNKVQQIIKRHIQNSDAITSNMSRATLHSPSLRHNQPSAATVRAFNSSFLKIPEIVQSPRGQKTSLQNHKPVQIKAIACEMVKAHEGYDKYNFLKYGQQVGLDKIANATFGPNAEGTGIELKSPFATADKNFHKSRGSHSLGQVPPLKQGQFAKTNAAPWNRKVSAGGLTTHQQVSVTKRTSNRFLEKLAEEEEEEQLEPLSVDQIVNEQTSRYAQENIHIKKPKKSTLNLDETQEKKPARKKSKHLDFGKRYVEEMPEQGVLEDQFRQTVNRRKQMLYQEVTKHSKELEGALTLNEAADRFDEEREMYNNEVNQYVKKFADIADLDHNYIHGSDSSTAFSKLAEAIKNKTNKKYVMIQVKKGKKKTFSRVPTIEVQAIKKEEKKLQLETRRSTLKDGELPKQEKESKFESLFQKATIHDRSTVKNKADEVIKRFMYYDKFKKRDMDEENKDDPALKYFKRCLEQNSLLLPIFEKIYHKTLCLQNYVLSEGQCAGLAEACQFIDHRKMNRVLFNNCGLTGNKMAVILEGLAQISDFKSIIYKHNELNLLAVAKLEALFLKQIPDHLSELQIIDCKIHCSVIEALCELMMETNSQVRTFGLVNVNHSQSSFKRMCEYIQVSERLRELNVSWQCVLPQVFFELLKIIRENRTLVSLNISWNPLIEKLVPTEDQIWRGINEVSQREKTRKMEATLICLADFIKYNIYLVHLDVSNCGLKEDAVMYLSSFLTKAQALQVLHLSGNLGVNPETIAWITERIHGVEKPPEVVIPQMNKEFMYDKFEKQPMKGNLIKLWRKRSSILHQPPEADQMLWKNIREGLKLQDIVQSKRINEQNKIDYSNRYHHTLILQRHLGFKELLPMSHKWKVCHEEHSECWYCNQHLLTLFVWVPRISQLAENKDPEVRLYYDNNLLVMQKNKKVQPIKESNIPHIAGPFTNWDQQPMREIVPFVQEYDPDPPDFLQQAIDEQLIRITEFPNGDGDQWQPSAADQKKLDELKDAYYKSNWQRAILNFTRFANPNIANSNALSKLTFDHSKAEGEEEPTVYFHAAFLRPGRTSYSIERQEFGQLDVEQDQNELVARTLTALENLTGAVDETAAYQNREFHVHQMLTGFRTDLVPTYYNPRHVRQRQFEKYKSKDVFKNFQWEDQSVDMAAAMSDLQFVNFTGLGIEEEETKKIQHAIKSKDMPILKEIHLYLQSQSDSYPFIDYSVFRERFLQWVKMPQGPLDKASYDSILGSADFSSKMMERCPKYCMCRASLMEVLLRVAKYLYCDYAAEHDLRNAEAKGATEVRVPLIDAWRTFVDTKLSPYYLDHQLDRMAFREEKLFDYHVDMVYSINQAGVKAAFKDCAVRCPEYRRHKLEILSPHDCVRIIRDQLQINIAYKPIRAAYAFSKQIVTNEQEEKNILQYERMNYNEFLEFIARIADIWFEGTEMEEIPLYRKVEYFLERLLKLVDLQVMRQQTIIEDFSDSDQDD